MVNQPRLCWDGARVFARAAASEDWCGWLADQLGRTFGPAYRQALVDSRVRLRRAERPDALTVEMGMWRVRLDDLLRAVPEADVALRLLIDEVSTRLGAVAAR
jgi:hypothetical protein